MRWIINENIREKIRVVSIEGKLQHMSFKMIWMYLDNE